MPLSFQILATDGLRAAGAGSPRRTGSVETPGVHAGGHARRGQGGDPAGAGGRPAPRSCSPTSTTWRCGPGIDVIERLGGLHAFTGWSRADPHRQRRLPGVQPAAACARSTTGGVTFRSHLDGSPLRFTPEGVVDLQERIGVDVAMVLDECPPWPVDPEAAAASWERTLDWARARPRGLDRRTRAAASSASSRGASTATCASGRRRSLAELDFDGYAIGGVSRGRDRGRPPRRGRVDGPGAAGGQAALPDGRRLPGGHPPRRAPRGSTSSTACCRRATPATACSSPAAASLKIKNARYRDDPRPLDPECGCPACRADLARLPPPPDARSGELTGGGARDPPQPALLP